MSLDFAELREDFANKFSYEEYDNIVDGLIQESLEAEDGQSINAGDWYSHTSECKINALNCYTTVSLKKKFINEKGDEDEHNVEIVCEQGINVGCELIDYDVDGDNVSVPKKVYTVITDLKLDLNAIKLFEVRTGKTVSLKLAELMLEREKDNIMEIYRKRSYDNYVTGGGTNLTDKYYSDKIAEYNNKGLYWDCVTEEVEAD